MSLTKTRVEIDFVIISNDYGVVHMNFANAACVPREGERLIIKDGEHESTGFNCTVEKVFYDYSKNHAVIKSDDHKENTGSHVAVQIWVREDK